MKPKTTKKKTTRRQRIEKIKAELRGKNLDGMNLKLRASDRKGFTRRFVKDNPQRIARFKTVGWQFAEPCDGEITPRLSGGRLGVSLGRTSEGGGTDGLLMEIPTDRYDAIQELKRERIEATMAGMKEGRYGEKPGDNRYVPSGGISIG